MSASPADVGPVPSGRGYPARFMATLLARRNCHQASVSDCCSGRVTWERVHRFGAFPKAHVYLLNFGCILNGACWNATARRSAEEHSVLSIMAEYFIVAPEDRWRWTQ
jgi:hypothetical protein